MLKDNNNIDSVFKSGLSDYGEDMPDYTWNYIEEQIKKNKKKKRLIIYLSFAASVLLIVTFMSGYLLNNYTKKSSVDKYNTADLKSNENEIKIPVNNHIAEKVETIEKIKNIEKTKTTEKTKYLFKKNSDYLPPLSLNDNNTDIIKANETYLSQIDTISTEQQIINEDIDFIVNVTYKDTTINNDSILNKTYITNQILDISNEDLLPENEIPDEIIDDQLATNQSKWSIGGGFSPAYSYSNNQNTNWKDNNNAVLGAYEDALVQRDETTAQVFSITGGLIAQHQISKRFGIQSGLNYSKYNDKNSITEIPFLVSYKIINKRFGLYPKAGLSTGFLSNNYKTTLVNNTVLGIEGKYSITKRIAFSITPTFKYYLPFLNGSGYNSKYFGVFSGLSYNLK